MLADKIEFINKVFQCICNAKTISELNEIPNVCGIKKKNQMDTSVYPKIEFKISSNEILSLIELGLLDEKFNLVNDISSRLDNPISKLLYALAWKNGDLKKLKHIAKGISESKSDNSDQDEALVFYQFGKYLTGEKGQPIIDQHVLRAYGIYQAFKTNDDCSSYLTMKTLDRSHKPLINSYKVWLRSDEISAELKTMPEYTYHIDKILFAAGKAVKIQNSFDSSKIIFSEKASRSTRLTSDRQEHCPQLNEGATYYPLQEYFRKRAEAKKVKVVISVSEIEILIQQSLPAWAFTRAAGFWGNTGFKSHVQKRAWLSKGFMVEDYQLNAAEHSGTIIFRNTNF